MFGDIDTFTTTMKMLVFIVIVVFTAACQGITRTVIFYPELESEETVQLFQDWTTLHGKVYSGKAEWYQRYQTFIQNLKIINELNARPTRTVDPAIFGPTNFADLSPLEFKGTILLPPWRPLVTQTHFTNRSTQDPPESFDWTDQEGVVTTVKDQGKQGTCWAFVGVANIEGQWTLKSGKSSPSLSPQSLNDCDGLSNIFTNAIACGPLGGLMPGVWKFIEQEGGIMTEDDYPYCMGDGACSPCQPAAYNEIVCGGRWPIRPCFEEDSCTAKYDPSKFVEGLKATGYTDLTSDEDLLRDGLVQTGPLAAGIDATDMQFYTGGILTPNKCTDVVLNHAVVLVGYGGQSTDQFWKAKNSWGTKWGEKGFLRIQRGSSACGINTDVSSIVLE